MFDASETTPVEFAADVVVVGGGAGGLAAAVAAAECGASVLVVEKSRVLGGNGIYAEGIFAADSLAQKANGVEAHKDDMFKAAMGYAHWSLNGRLVRAFIDKSGDTVRWLEDKGVGFPLVLPFTSKQTLRVFHNPPGGGPEIIQALLDQCNELGVRILCDVAAERVLRDDSGRVNGIEVSLHGTWASIATESVVIATGGFVGNEELMKKHCRIYAEGYSTMGHSHMGDGVTMIDQAGAAMEGMGNVQASGPNFRGNFSDLVELAREPGPIWLNSKGERFTDEATSFNDFECVNAILRQGSRCWVMLDQAMVEYLRDNGLDRVYLGSLRPSGVHPVPGLEDDLRMAAQGLMPVAQINRDLCNGCGACVDCCPETTIDLDTSLAAGQPGSPCSSACPAGVNVRAYVHLLRNGRVDEAIDMLREDLPLPGVTGRICPHLCEAKCSRNDVDSPVNVNALERFIADSERGRNASPIEKKYDDRVAVIGSGPAGLSCAYFLARAGYSITVFEAQNELGGMLRLGIPEYRLPRTVLDEQIAYIRDMGVEFKTGVSVGTDISLALLEQDYGAVFFAGGAQASRKINVEGTELAGVEWGVEFLRQVNLGQKTSAAPRVVVVGGGNVAVDVALTALRLGAEQVSMACLECGDDVPAYPEEIAQALAEGVVIHEGWGPDRIIGDGAKVSAIELVECTSVEDEQGCFNPSFNEANKKMIEADMIVLAIGQMVDERLVPDPALVGGSGTVTVEDLTLETKRKGVFAGGDVAGGTSSVVKAIADGRKAAGSIDRYLRDLDLRTDRWSPPEALTNPPGAKVRTVDRMESSRRHASDVVGDFTEVKLGWGELQAKLESERCMTCGSLPLVKVEGCKLCGGCLTNCPTQAVYKDTAREEAPHVKISEDLTEIARWIGADPKSLEATVNEYNDACDNGHDPLFAKDRMYLRALRKPPYYALRTNVNLLTTLGGARVNEDLGVLDASDQAIPGLFAAGNDVGGWECDTYNAYLPGSTFGFAINSGRIAGEAAAAHAGAMLNCSQSQNRRQPL